MSKNPAAAVAAYSDTLVCRQCGKPLEVARVSVLISSTAGLLAGFLVYRLTRNSPVLLGWVLPMVYSILAWAIASPLLLMFTADLRYRVETQSYETAPGVAAPAHH
jgi:hypothetical protein